MDGNRTRRTGITHPTRFEGGGAHQALGHLQRRRYRRAGRHRHRAGASEAEVASVGRMSKNRTLLFVVLAVLLAVLARKVRDV